jgi:hypothetical protein
MSYTDAGDKYVSPLSHQPTSIESDGRGGRKKESPEQLTPRRASRMEKERS